jgi:hypothetical protein
MEKNISEKPIIPKLNIEKINHDIRDDIDDDVTKNIKQQIFYKLLFMLNCCLSMEKEE